jgi:hypothetical protein
MSDNPSHNTETAHMQVMRFNDGDRWNCALIKIGTKHFHAVHLDDSGVRVTKGPKEDVREMTPLFYRGAPYPVARFLKSMRRVGKERGITEAAKAIMEECGNE